MAALNWFAHGSSSLCPKLLLRPSLVSAASHVHPMGLQRESKRARAPLLRTKALHVDAAVSLLGSPAQTGKNNFLLIFKLHFPSLEEGMQCDLFSYTNLVLHQLLTSCWENIYI